MRQSGTFEQFAFEAILSGWQLASVKAYQSEDGFHRIGQPLQLDDTSGFSAAMKSLESLAECILGDGWLSRAFYDTFYDSGYALVKFAKKAKTLDEWLIVDIDFSRK